MKTLFVYSYRGLVAAVGFLAYAAEVQGILLDRMCGYQDRGR